LAGPFSAVNHAGFVVRDLDEGIRFFVDVLGFEIVADRKGTLSPNGDMLTRLFGVPAEASGRYQFFQLGGTVIELLEWSAPGQNTDQPLSSDLSARHLALSVSDMDAALDRLGRVPGVSIREANDRGFRYCTTPLGLDIQLIPI
jgi:catechol 2,3-dioxygenase-like lactoylglutathione lyase family enzyme